MRLFRSVASVSGRRAASLMAFASGFDPEKLSGKNALNVDSKSTTTAHMYDVVVPLNGAVPIGWVGRLLTLRRAGEAVVGGSFAPRPMSSEKSDRPHGEGDGGCMIFFFCSHRKEQGGNAGKHSKPDGERPRVSGVLGADTFQGNLRAPGA
jgi:hypothetical protein